MSKICVIGAGYVGLVTSACFSDLGNRVACLDIDKAKIEMLLGGKMPIFEPGLSELVHRNTAAARLSFTTSYEEAVDGAEFAFVAVHTPSSPDGGADMRYVESAVTSLGKSARNDVIVVTKSTMPAGSGDWVETLVNDKLRPGLVAKVVSNPEFLREGSAVRDFMHPDRVVLGGSDRRAVERVAELYRPLNAPIIVTDKRTAEMIKYASNSFLATKISFINEIASICEQVGADVKQVAGGMAYDDRIGPDFLGAGLGWGGSCFPKDVRALEHLAATNGCHPQLLRSVMEINNDQRRRLVGKIQDAIGIPLKGKVVGILGLSFKPNTDDIRDAPSLSVIDQLVRYGAQVRVYDPVTVVAATGQLDGVFAANDPYECAAGADALALVTEWNEFKHLDLTRLRKAMRQPIMVDGRNVYDPATIRAAGFKYISFGRP
jgi:UDPglucose 6-dehydrogenase